MTVKVTTPKKGALEEQVWTALQKQLTSYIERKLRNIRCPEHDERPRVNVTGTLKKPEFKIEGCCQKLVSETAEALK